MLKHAFLKHKWRRMRLRVWKRRLTEQLDRLARVTGIAFPVTLSVTWGPFYNGSAILNRTLRQARIDIQIPYDRYLTADERKVLSRYGVPRRHLPYFILFHEYAHLADAANLIRQAGSKALLAAGISRAKLAKAAADYRELPFEAAADQFACRCYRDLCKKAG
ncbi:hypothetical protein ACI7RC_01250 [Brevibacillus sp. B_LB10_24]|uniref:hypothetical protein n=1 Tax=Brevibacillus sp. B_LB10_24 TaxID=3380645 RepID=UPI0038BA78C6